MDQVSNKAETALLFYHIIDTAVENNFNATPYFIGRKCYTRDSTQIRLMSKSISSVSTLHYDVLVPA